MYNRSFLIRKMHNSKYIGAEWRVPPFEDIVEPSFFGPITLSFLFFCSLGFWVRKLLWKDHSPFERYRITNTTVSLIHSTITGGCSLLFMLINPDIMFHDVMHWYQVWAAMLVLFSMGYFVYDAMDIVRHERSKYAFEIFAHHAVIFLIFSTGMLAHKFLPYAYWALLVEVNSVFLHMRTIMRLSRIGGARDELYRVIRILSVGTFIVFRFGVLFWMGKYLLLNRSHFHSFFTCAGLFAVSFFFILSIFLFLRILAEEGFLGNHAELRISTKRDTKGPQRNLENAKSS